MENQTFHHSFVEVVVIGSGFGGAVACCRLAQKWPSKVVLLERGRRYPKGTFSRSPHDFSNNFWATGSKPGGGLFDIRNFSRMDVVGSAGLGGGSLTYANVFLEPPAWVFKQDWPTGFGLDMLKPYYRIAKSVLAAKPMPPVEQDSRRRVLRSELFAAFAQTEGKASEPAELCVFFGNAYGNSQTTGAAPTDMGLQETNRFGAVQTSCTYCGECDVGCNVHAKNTLDLNYLYAAEHQHGARICTDSQAEKIVPLDAQGQEDSTANGQFGYRVYYRSGAGELQTISTRRVVVAAGTLGTNELLLRCRDEYGSLPRLSPQLGHRFSGNGDFVAFVVQGQRDADPNYGPVITRFVDFDYLQGSVDKNAFLLEDAAYPTFAAWYVEGLRPMLNPGMVFHKLKLVVVLFWRRLKGLLLGGRWDGSVAEYAKVMLGQDMSYRSSVLLCMGKDKGGGVFSVKQGRFDLMWPQQASRPLYDAILACGKRFKAFVGSSTYLPQPNWLWPMRNNITVHPLGGCALADTPEQGVVSAGAESRGQVFGYQGLYVADGSLMPASLGANPSATITALSEWIAEGITGLAPDDTLGVPQP